MNLFNQFILYWIWIMIDLFVAFAIGKGALAGGSIIGLGALGFYGLGLGKSTNVLNNSL